MTKAKTMESSLDVFELQEEDELTQMPVRKITTKFGSPHALDHKDGFLDLISGTEIQSEEIHMVICGGTDAADIDYNHDSGGSFIPIQTEDFAKEKMPELNHVLQNDFKSLEQATNIESNNLGSGSVFAGAECGSIPGATVWLEDHSNCAFPESSCNDDSVRLASDADEMSERSPASANNNASSDGPSSDNCFPVWNLGDDMVEIAFYPDYIDYRGTYYLDSVVTFSRNSVEAKSKTIYGDEGTFHIHLEIKDIVKIESQWSARYEAGTINIYFISKDATQDDIVSNASGLQELKFPAVDSNWYRKQEAIESLDVRYKALWSVILDTGMEKCSALPEGRAMMVPRSYFPNFKEPFEEVIYPKGDPDAVSICKRDIDLLLPDVYVNDTIIDFYIKYLKTRRNVEERTKFHFFNSFFFRKLADMDKDPSSAFDGNAAFHRVRKWTRKVNLLEKDFIFIPVNYSFHWSLIVICYFGEVASYKDVEDDKSVRVPCILHMDSIRGTHVGIKDLIQSYLWEEWKERQKDTCEDMYSKFRNLKFVSLELPQQQNSCDCGLFLLHYVELFLEEVPADFSIYKITSSSKFLQADWFPPGEASMKRGHIERLINVLLDTQSEDLSPSDGSGMHCSPDNRNATHDYENGVEFSGKCGTSRGCHESSPCLGKGIEMTLLPASSITSTHCTRTSGLVFKELFEQGSASESFGAAPWVALESRASLHEFTRPVPLTEEEMEAGECFVQTELAEPALQHLDGVNLGAPVYPYSSSEFKLEPVHQATFDDADSSPVTSPCDSGDALEVETDEKWQSVEAVSLDDELDKHRCMSLENMERSTLCIAYSSEEVLNRVESLNLVEISGQNGDSFFLKNLPEQEANQLQASDNSSRECLANCPAFAFGDKLDVSECENPYRVVNSDDQAHPHAFASEDSSVSSHQGNDMQGGSVDHESLSESGEQHAAKRMRIMPPDGGDELTRNFSKDLHL